MMTFFSRKNFLSFSGVRVVKQKTIERDLHESHLEVSCWCISCQSDNNLVFPRFFVNWPNWWSISVFHRKVWPRKSRLMVSYLQIRNRVSFICLYIELLVSQLDFSHSVVNSRGKILKHKKVIPLGLQPLDSSVRNSRVPFSQLSKIQSRLLLANDYEWNFD